MIRKQETNSVGEKTDRETWKEEERIAGKGNREKTPKRKEMKKQRQKVGVKTLNSYFWEGF